MGSRGKAPALFAFLALTLLPSMVQAAEVEVVVAGVRGGRGAVRVALCGEAEFLGFDCAYYGETLAADGVVVVRIRGVTPGVYAAEAFHDDDNSGKLETSFFGLPRKGMGFSRDARMRFGPPRFGDAAMRVSAEGGRFEVVLHYPE